jgi:hypothetical protein
MAPDRQVRMAPVRFRPPRSDFHASPLPRCGALAASAALLVASGGSEPATQGLTLKVVTAPGLIEFDKQHLTTKAGRIDDVCCIRPGSKDIGGTQHGTLVVR